MLRIASAALFISLGLCAGCGKSGPRRLALHGKVVTNRPVESLSLHPFPELNAPAVSTTVVNGEYRFTRDDGPVPGQYRAVFRFTDDPGTFGSGAPTGKKKEVVVAPVVKQAAPPPPAPDVTVTVPADGNGELDIVIP